MGNKIPTRWYFIKMGPQNFSLRNSINTLVLRKLGSAYLSLTKNYYQIFDV